jgi:hypothetical protein
VQGRPRRDVAAVSEIQRHLRSIAAAYGYDSAHISVLPTFSLLPAFWLLVPGTIGLIGITEIAGDDTEAGTENLATALAAIPAAVALGILVGTMVVRPLRDAGSRHQATSGEAHRAVATPGAVPSPRWPS